MWIQVLFVGPTPTLSMVRDRDLTRLPAKPTKPASFELSVEVVYRINPSTFALRTCYSTCVVNKKLEELKSSDADTNKRGRLADHLKITFAQIRRFHSEASSQYSA